MGDYNVWSRHNRREMTWACPKCTYRTTWVLTGSLVNVIIDHWDENHGR